eukprot:scaffold1759_cov284-Prasinococcus_capsulatus_cf.AAC.1
MAMAVVVVGAVAAVAAAAAVAGGDGRAFTEALPGVPVLANMTEFGQTPLCTTEVRTSPPLLLLCSSRHEPARRWCAGAAVGRGEHGAVPAVGLPRDEPGGGGGVRADPGHARQRERRGAHAHARADLRRHRLPRPRGP